MLGEPGTGINDRGGVFNSILILRNDRLKRLNMQKFQGGDVNLQITASRQPRGQWGLLNRVGQYVSFSPANDKQIKIDTHAIAVGINGENKFRIRYIFTMLRLKTIYNSVYSSQNVND